ncbi:pyocin knob domain-containing protein [Bacteroides clarus]|uniref:pyocin knob domain-containing protein n=1 Tax=Bacteroides clarus TaxID=626929 RepID=UPI002677626D|nr:pyocin knob domain-containing protein [Bacteroides clarus]
MPSKKIKISELPLVESLKGLYTIGYKIIDGIKTSVKVSLEDIQTAYQDVVNAVKNSEVATKNANTAASNANEKAVLADTAAANANDTAEHPTYIGQDHYVYKWNKTAQAYDKTDIYTKGDAFSIKKVYASVANMEADKSNPDITEGDFVLVNTGDVEDPDNAKLYVKADGDFEFLVDMSGAIGFTGKTPQFSMGTISTLEAGATATATISEDGVDSDGNPKYKINFAIPRGNPGAPFRIAGEYATLEALKSAVPDGSAVDGFMAVGTEAPYDYYAWVNGDWVNQGKITGGGSGNVVVIPAAAMSISDQATSDEIFNAFGGKDAFMDICQSIVNKDTVCVVANIPEESGMKIVYIPAMAMATYTDANNANLMIAIITQTTFQLGITVTDGVATQSYQVLNHIYEAPSDGNVYGRKNKDWVEVPEHLNLTSEDLNDINGAGFATQKSIAGYTTPENNYPINENGALIFANAHYSRSNQIYGSYLTNRWFARGGGNQQGIRTDWKEFVFTGDVLTKTNTSSFTPTQPYHPATKKYVDDKVYVVNNSTWEEVLRNNKSINGTDVQALVNKLFGSYSEFLSLLQGVNDNVYIGLKFTDWMYDDANGYGVGSSYTASNLYAKHNTAEGEFNCNFTYFYKNALKCCIINVNEASNHNYDKLIIQDIVTSDNLTTITKKTAAEYEALGSKDANTAYCVTD